MPTKNHNGLPWAQRPYLSTKGVLVSLETISTYIGIPHHLSLDYAGQLPHKPDEKPLIQLARSSHVHLIFDKTRIYLFSDFTPA